MHALTPHRATTLRPDGEWTARLLWESCRHEPRADAVLEAVALGADMEQATSASIAHRIAPLLWRALTQAEAIEALGPSQDSLRSVFDTYRMEALLLLPRAVSRAVSPLTDAGLEPVVLKGPALAARYPQPGLRPMEDIDLLLPKAQHVAASSALIDAGWRIVRPSTRDDYDTMFTHPDVPSLSLELHFGLEHPSQRVTTLDGDALWQRRQPIDCLGTAAFGLPLSEELVFLSAHAGKPHHGFFRLIWVADLAMVVGHATASGATLDWDDIETVARNGSCLTMVAAAFALAGHAGVDVPVGMFPLPNRGWRGNAMEKLTATSWPLSHLDLPGYHLNYALADSRIRRLRILLVLLGSGYGIGRRARGLLDGPQRRVGRRGASTSIGRP